jgi:hypothetical protein
MRLIFNVTPEGARRQFDAGLQALAETIDDGSAAKS